MAPVGRWQKGKDLQWYARNRDIDGAENDGMTEEERLRKERQDEIARIKQAEREALNKALGYEVNPDGPLGNNTEATGANASAVIGNKAANRDEKTAKDKRRGHRHKHRHSSRERHEERSFKHHRDRSRSRSKERRYRDDARARSGSRDRREQRDLNHQRTRRSDDNYRPKRSDSSGWRRRSRSSSSDRTKHRTSRGYGKGPDSRSPYRQRSPRNRRKEESRRH